MYPEEAEETFPPLTLMKPVKRTGAAGVGACVDSIVGATPNDMRHTTIVVGDLTFTIVLEYRVNAWLWGVGGAYREEVEPRPWKLFALV